MGPRKSSDRVVGQVLERIVVNMAALLPEIGKAAKEFIRMEAKSNEK